MTIILDLDDVLANLRDALQRILQRETGIDLHWRHWEHYDLRRHYLLESPVLDELLMRERVLEICEPESGAAGATAMLAELGLQVVIVTARGWHPRADPISRDWLDRHGVVYHDLRVVPLGGNKLRAIEDCRDVRLAVDDHPANVERYRREGVPALIMDRPWNADAPGDRVYSATEMVDYVRGLL